MLCIQRYRRRRYGRFESSVSPRCSRNPTHGFVGQLRRIDRTAVDFKTPADIKWVRNAAGTNESAVLFGDPAKPGPYVVRLKWLPGNMSRPHFHPNDRFF